MEYLIVMGIGLTAGVLSGFFGVGGGVLIVPALALLIPMEQHAAVGTSLAALLPPVDNPRVPLKLAQSRQSGRIIDESMLACFGERH